MPAGGGDGGPLPGAGWAALPGAAARCCPGRVGRRRAALPGASRRWAVPGSEAPGPGAGSVAFKDVTLSVGGGWRLRGGKRYEPS